MNDLHAVNKSNKKTPGRGRTRSETEYREQGEAIRHGGYCSTSRLKNNTGSKPWNKNKHTSELSSCQFGAKVREQLLDSIQSHAQENECAHALQNRSD